MRHCSVCHDLKSPFVLNNRTVCLKCDELLFDLEIECEELDTTTGVGDATTPVKTEKRPKKLHATAKK